MNEINEKISFTMGVRFAASFNMGKNFLDVWTFNLLSSSKMGINYAKGPFIMGMFYTGRCH